MAKAQPASLTTTRSVLRLLIVEDRAADVELMVATLKRAGYSLSFDVAESPTEFQQRLEHAEYDLVLCDHNLGSWAGTDALEMLQQPGQDIPFVVVTGALGDEAAVEYIKQGAADYVLKDRLERLPVAVGRALQEKAHREEAARLQEVILCAKREWELTFDSVPDVVLLLDEDGRIQRANRAAVAVLGLEFPQLIGKPYREALQGVGQARPDYPQQESGKEAQGLLEEPRSGKVFDVTSTPLRDHSEVLRGGVVVIRDITERKRAEEALRDREERLALLLDSTAEAIYGLDLQGNCSFCNSSCLRLLGYGRPEDLLGKNIHAQIHHARPEGTPYPEQECRIYQAFRKGEGTHVDDEVLWRADGTSFAAEYRSFPVRRDGELVGSVVTFLDISQRRGLEEQLRQSQKMEAVGRLAGGIAHDFNNILTVIKGYSDLLLEEVGSTNDRLRRAADEIYKSADRAAALTHQLLAFSRRQVLEPKLLDLNEVVAEMDQMLQRLIGEDIQLVSIRRTGLGQVKADPGQIEQVILNLAVNARDAMPQGGKLTIETANVELDEDYARAHVVVGPGDYVMLAVSDSGCGMDAETQAHLFEPFFTTKEKGKGTGLGLATVYGIVKQSGGNIWVYSELGQGTTFKVYLPRVWEAAKTIAPGTPVDDAASDVETILLVEDEKAVRELAAWTLERNGYTVLAAGDAAEATQLAQRHERRIHLLLTDVEMPEVSGPQLAQRLASLRPGIKVLYMSGYTDDAVVHHGVLEPGVAFLQKPFTAADLARKVRQALER